MAESTYYRRKRLGQCVMCGGMPIEGKTMCETCARKNSEKQHSDRIAYKAYGICAMCHHAKPKTGRVTCEACLQKKSESEKRIRRLKHDKIIAK